jgi:hypothetical protein
MNADKITAEYRKRFLANQATFQAQHLGLIDKVTKDIARMANDPTVRLSRAFKFNKPTYNKIENIITEFHDKSLALNEEEIVKAWKLSGLKNDAIVNEYISSAVLLKESAKRAEYFLPNTKALESFIAREHGTMTLSDRVWKIADQLRAEMEAHLSIGLVNGDSASVISRRVRQYLKEPEALFRRVRDKNGKLVASQAMIDNKPGRGVYNSAFKNSMRLTRSEANMSYLNADFVRWSQLDMVIGVRVSLSSSHPKYNYPEICEVCAGVYPKFYKFIGWHSCCLCNATPELMPDSDFMAYLRGDNETLKADQIDVMPKNFISYAKENFNKLSEKDEKKQPYWFRDNKKIIDKIIK